ncbi:hypothetical protein AWC25_06515 [Mycobacterium sherrisii]|uniref:Transmembrane protein n=1 Tax=Mycobacterium sherrisii TaxID=243061 RepID=A0A1E3SUU2_9MYCO|nr:hypothetical protein [Mycobacterium sherrisii]ODR05922.1 hypothetical protein BHQ21_12960 [Mycobacterium sherrisii]ORW78353.1 hypothetical protein AWC25_06515 [Mycobacterium sherrisii]
MADKDAEHGPATNPGTEPFVPDFDSDDGGTDTGTQGFVPDFDDTGAQPIPVLAGHRDAAKNTAEPGKPEVAPAAERDAGTPEASGAPAQSVSVPGRYQYLKWWKLALVILGTWAVTAEVGLSLFYWWYHTIDKAAPVFMTLVYVVACVVGAVMLAMVQGKPVVAALSIAVLSGPFGSLLAAAPLYGYYYCARVGPPVGHCVIGVIPY